MTPVADSASPGQIEVTQEDREAAAAIVRWQREAADQWNAEGGSTLQFFVADFSRAIMQGIWDQHPVVQAFARHRATAIAQQDALIGEIEAERRKPVQGLEHGAWDRGRRAGLDEAIRIAARVMDRDTRTAIEVGILILPVFAVAVVVVLAIEHLVRILLQ
jgi:hypothetical protein